MILGVLGLLIGKEKRRAERRKKTGLFLSYFYLSIYFRRCFEPILSKRRLVANPAWLGPEQGIYFSSRLLLFLEYIFFVWVVC